MTIESLHISSDLGNKKRSHTEPPTSKGASVCGDEISKNVNPFFSSTLHTGSLIFEKGIKLSPIYRPESGIQPSWLANCERGEIKTFSTDSATRLREFLIMKFVPETHLYACTLTTRKKRSPEEWRKLIHDYRCRLNRAVVPGVWRVELQRRGTPHLHCIFSLSTDQLNWIKQYRTITDGWWELIGCKVPGENFFTDGAERMYSIMIKPANDEYIWTIYTALHHSKHKKNQLGWVGKHWGVWCRNQYQNVPTECTMLGLSQRVLLCRRLRSWSRNRIPGKRLPPLKIVFNRSRTLIMPPGVSEQIIRGLKG